MIDFRLLLLKLNSKAIVHQVAIVQQVNDIFKLISYC